MEKYPQHEKLKKLDGANNTVGDFLSWLESQGIVLARWGYPTEGQVCVNIKHWARSDKRELEALIEMRDVALLGEWLDENDFADDIELADTAWGWGQDVWGDRMALPDPQSPSQPWYVTLLNDKLLWPAQERIEDLIARFFDIDAHALAEEKDALYRELVEASR